MIYVAAIFEAGWIFFFFDDATGGLFNIQMVKSVSEDCTTYIQNNLVFFNDPPGRPRLFIFS